MHLKYVIFISTLTQLFFFNTPVNAALFGPSNYEECVSDGRTGRSNAEIGLLASKCLRDFPVLPKIAKNKAAEISCISIVDQNIFNFKINKYLIKSDKFTFYSINRNSDSIFAKNTQYIKGANYSGNYSNLLTLNFFSGTMTIYGTPEGKSAIERSFIGNCSEIN